MIIECPASGCALRFVDRKATLGHGGGHQPRPSTTTCRNCGQVIQFGLLILDGDEVWRVSPFAGHADDVRLAEPPGGKVAYEPRTAPEAGATVSGLTAGDLQARQRALAAIEGRAPGVGAGAERDAVGLALELGVLDEEETGRARAWLARR